MNDDPFPPRTLVYRRLFGGRFNGRRHQHPLTESTIVIPYSDHRAFTWNEFAAPGPLVFKSVMYYKHSIRFADGHTPGQTVVVWWSNESSPLRAHAQLEKWWYRGAEFE